MWCLIKCLKFYSQSKTKIGHACVTNCYKSRSSLNVALKKFARVRENYKLPWCPGSFLQIIWREPATTYEWMSMEMAFSYCHQDYVITFSWKKKFCCKVQFNSHYRHGPQGGAVSQVQWASIILTLLIKMQTPDSQSSWIAGLSFYLSASSPLSVETHCWSVPAGLQEAPALGTALLSGLPGAPCRRAHGLNGVR